MRIKFCERSTVSAKHSESLRALYRSPEGIQLFITGSVPTSYTHKALILRKAKQNKAVAPLHSTL